MLIVGQKEVDTGTVSVRKHGKGDIGVVQADDIIIQIKRENEERSKE